MKRLVGIIVLGSVMMCLSAATVFAQSAIPDLKGKWVSKTYSHHHEKRGFYSTADAGGEWMIKEQQGRFFTGERTYVKKQIKGKKITEGFSGVISRDGKRFYMVDHDEDMIFGEIVAADILEMVVMNDGDENHHAHVGVLEVHKVKP